MNKEVFLVVLRDIDELEWDENMCVCANLEIAESKVKEYIENKIRDIDKQIEKAIEAEDFDYQRELESDKSILTNVHYSRWFGKLQIINFIPQIIKLDYITS